MFYERLFEPREFDRLTGFIGLGSRGMDAGHRVNVGGRSDLWPSVDAQEAARRRLAPTYDDARRRFGADVPESWVGSSGNRKAREVAAPRRRDPQGVQGPVTARRWNGLRENGDRRPRAAAVAA